MTEIKDQSDVGADLLDELIVIPARYKSSRLPGKPLVNIAGKPMLVRTAERCFEVKPRESVLVATDDDRIAEVCEVNGLRYMMTQDHPTGTDRVAEVASRIKAKTYINVQGDEPVFNPQDLVLLSEETRKDPGQTYIGYCDMPQWQWRDTKYTRLLFGLEKNLIYIGRGPMPFGHTGEFSFSYRQVCLHAYPGDALAKFHAVEGKTPIEAVEDHEMMRFLELGLPVKVLPMSDESMPVDRDSDIPLVEKRIAELGL